MEPRRELMNLTIGHMPARAVQVAAQLGLADLVLMGKVTAEALAAETGIDPWPMQRFLRILVALGLFSRDGDGYGLTAKGAFLSRSHPESIDAWIRMHGYFFQAFTPLEAVLKTGVSGYELSAGRKHFDAMAEMPDFAAAFDMGMNQMFIPETEAMIARFDFGRFSSLMDVGGGNGEVLLRVLEKFPHMTGTLFDLPHVVDRAAARIGASPAADRCATVGGSFFEPLPGGAQAILLRHIIHDWMEEDALAILSNCRDALAPGGTLLIGEALIEEADHLTLPIRLDLTMMAYYNGAERTLEEYRALLAKAGMEITAVTEATPSLAIIEAKRA